MTLAVKPVKHENLLTSTVQEYDNLWDNEYTRQTSVLSRHLNSWSPSLSLKLSSWRQDLSFLNVSKQSRGLTHIIRTVPFFRKLCHISLSPVISNMPTRRYAALFFLVLTRTKPQSPFKVVPRAFFPAPSCSSRT